MKKEKTYVYIITPDRNSDEVKKVGITKNPKTTFVSIMNSDKQTKDFLDWRKSLGKRVPHMSLIECGSKKEAEDLKEKLSEKYSDTILSSRRKGSKYEKHITKEKKERWL